MILGIGNDMVEILRIAGLYKAQGEKFLERCFTQGEQDYALSKNDGAVRAGALAKRFAAKEACAKALGTGISGGILFTDIDVRRDENGTPSLALYGKALERLEALTPDGHEAVLHLSLSDDAGLAQAFVIIEARPL